MDMKLAYYTCYFGGEYNYSNVIPPLPSVKYDCYFFTNNHQLAHKLKDTWKIIFMEIPIHNCDVKDTMETKEIRCCPHRFDVLNQYEYLCWFDTKLAVYENKIEELMLELEKTDKIIVLTKHPYSDRFNSVWDEFNLSMAVPKYYSQKERYENYIRKQINLGFSEKINVHFCNGWSLKKKCKKMEEYNELLYLHVQECGIEDQISLQFIQQKYIEHIMPVDYQYTWKYFYE